MTLPWGSDNGICLGPVEQTVEDTWPGSLHMSLPHILPEEGKRGRGERGGGKREDRGSEREDGGRKREDRGSEGNKKKRRNGNDNFICRPTLALFLSHS